MEDYYYRLIQDYFEKKISDEGLTDLRRWIEESPENLSAFRDTLHILGMAKSYLGAGSGHPESAWSKIRDRINGEETYQTEESGRIQHKWLLPGVAAAAIVVLTLLFLFPYSPDNGRSPAQFTEIVNPNGKRSKITLPDGSIVYLNAGSRIRYNKALGSLQKREVSLDGEAFFDVAHKSASVFIVRSGSVTTKVLGTSFNVRAFKEEKAIAVTVRSGKVSVSMTEKNGEKFLQYLLPEQQLSINTSNGNYSFSHLDVSDVISWKENKIVFSNASLEQIGRSLERWYGVKVVFTHPGHLSCRYTAKFDYLPLNRLMDILSQLTQSSYSINDNQLIINNQSCKQEEIMD